MTLRFFADWFRLVISHIECSFGGHEWFLVGDGTRVCRCCLLHQKPR